MKKNLRTALAVTLCLAICVAPALAQSGNNVKTNTRILYHDGPIMAGTTAVYVIWYGGWNGSAPGNNPATQSLLVDLITNLGSTPYFSINTAYPDSAGFTPSGALIYAGSFYDDYSRGSELNILSIRGIISDKLASFELLLDPNGIYLVLGTADISASDTGFCTPKVTPHHGDFVFSGTTVKYAFVGNALRCPSAAAPQFPGGPTPNNDLAADAMASTIAAVLSTIVTNPIGNSWFDRYGLENASKCQGTFGETYTTANGARANMRLGQRDWLLQQNWVNHPRKGYCALAAPTQ